jgi:hypothetical protein
MNVKSHHMLAVAKQLPTEELESTLVVKPFKLVVSYTAEVVGSELKTAHTEVVLAKFSKTE